MTLSEAASAQGPGAVRLAAAVEAFGAELGVPSEGDAVLTARLRDDTAGQMATALETLLACHRIARLPLSDAEKASELRRCGESVVAQVDTLGGLVDAGALAGSEPVDVWPVLRSEPGQLANTYVHDYVLLVDEAGDDRYFNNAGGNGIDLKRGPLTGEAARGCQTAREAVLVVECVLSAAALLDSSGDDTYGRLEAPDVDKQCTDDPVVRRILIQGAAAAGVGVLVDRRGNDRYTGKVLTTGAGHINGFGHLRDIGGDDEYAVIRIGQGAATVGGTGTLFDLGGDDVFDFYIPSGGVVDDQGNCDAESRHTLGAGNLGGTGHLRAEDGDDFYRSSERGQGSGRNGGFGSFVDTGGGTDTYIGVPGRRDNVTLLPTAENQGFFQDS